MELNLWWIVGVIIVYGILLLMAKASRHAGVATVLMVAANAAVIIFLIYVFSKS